MKHPAVRIAIYGCVAIALVSAAAIAWHMRERSRMFYTTADTVRVPDQMARIRDVLWQPSIELAPSINTSVDEYEPRVTLDGGTLIFVRGRAALNADLYTSTRTEGGWSEPAPMVGVNSPADELGPEPAPGGRAIYFSSNRAGGFGGYDLWVVHRSADGSWAEPVNLGPKVNSNYNEFAPSFAPEGTTLYFSSNRPIASGEAGDAVPRPARQAKRDYNIFVASVSDSGIDRVRDVPEINSPYDECSPSVSPLGDFIYFASNRPNGSGGFDIYRSRRQLGVPTVVTRLGDTVNSPYDELDPSASYGGFVLHYSSNRPPAGDAAGTAVPYNLYYAMSREVFAETETYRAQLDLLEMLRVVGPLLLYLLIAALLLLGMLKLETKHKKLTLIARCLLGSVLVHVVVLIGLSVWQVSTALIGTPKRGGGTQVVLSSPPSGADLASQVRGELVQVQPMTASAATTARQQAAVTDVPETAMATFAVERAALAAPDQASETIEATDAPPSPVREAVQPTDAPPTAQAAATAVALPRQPVRIEAAEAIAGVPRVEAEGVRFDPEASAALPVRPSLGDPSVAVTPSTADLAQHDTNRRRLVEERAAAETVAKPPAADGAAARVATNDTSSAARLPLPAEASTTVAASVESAPALEAREAATIRRDHAPGPQAAPVNTRTVELRPSTVESALASASLAVADPARDEDTTPPDLPPAPPAVAAAVDSARGPSLRLPGAADRVAEAPTANPSPEMSAADATLAARSSVQLQDAFEAQVDVQPPATESVAAGTSMVESRADVVDPAAPALPPLDVALGAREIARVAVGVPPNFAEASTAEAAPEASQRPELMSADTQRAALPPVVTGEGAPTPGGAVEPPPALTASAFAPDRLLEELSLDLDLDELFGTIEDSLLAPTRIGLHDPQMVAVKLPSPEATPQMQYHQRSEAVRRERIEELGGSQETEAAVASALDWLARHQSPDGRWDSNSYDAVCGHCPGASTMDVDVALTSLSLLAYLAAGHAPERSGPYQDNVDRGLTWLLAQQADDGSLLGEESMYSHAMATMALAEAYGMSQDEKYAPAVRAATDFIYEARNQTFGGWRYKPGQIGDTSVLGWQVMALMSAKRSGIEIEGKAIDVARRWLPEVADPLNPGLYAYQPAQNATPAMTAEAMFIMELLGFERDAAMQASADYILKSPPRWQRNTSYYWYYATLALFQYGGDEWARWNGRMKDVLLAHQSNDGETAGSWPPADKWGKTGGRIYQTAICTLTLEVYYRYLPLYARDVAWAPNGGD